MLIHPLISPLFLTETTIQIPPAFTRKPSVNIFTSLFNPVTLYCSATGQPVPRITWYKDGAVIPDAPIRTGTNDYLIKEITLADRGNYHCLAENSAGKVPSTPILVNIEGKRPCIAKCINISFIKVLFSTINEVLFLIF